MHASFPRGSYDFSYRKWRCMYPFHVGHMILLIGNDGACILSTWVIWFFLPEMTMHVSFPRGSYDFSYRKWRCIHISFPRGSDNFSYRKWQCMYPFHFCALTCRQHQQWRICAVAAQIFLYLEILKKCYLFRKYSTLFSLLYWLTWSVV
jgi:hypothetical protein